MRIVQINETCGTGSIGRLALGLAEHAEKCGHEVLFAYANGLPRYKNTYKIGNILDHKLHAFFSRVTGLQGYFSIFSTWLFLRRIKQFAPDVIHIHNLHSNYINIPILLHYLKSSNIHTVVTLHDSWLYTGKCTYYVPAKCEKWKTQCGSCPLLHRDNVNPTFFFDTTEKCLKDKKELFGYIDKMTVVGVSKWISNEAKTSTVFNSKDIETVYNWVNEKKFYYRTSELRKKYGIENKKVILMVANRLSKKKGQDELFYLSKVLPQEYVMVFIGQVNDNIKLPDSVIHVLHTNDEEELAEYYSMADVCVNTTQYESFGMVTVESLFCGTPVIVYNNTASQEIVDNSVGRVVQQFTKSYYDIVLAVEEICNTDINRELIASYAHNRFSEQNALNRYLNLYAKG